MTTVASTLAGALNASDAERRWLARVEQAFPAPTEGALRLLVQRLDQLAARVPWLRDPRLPADLLDPLEGLSPRLKGTGKFSRDMVEGAFLRLGTILSGPLAASQPRGLEAFRAALWACAWQWDDHERVTAIDTLASAIRAVQAGGTRLPSLSHQVLFGAGEASSMGEFLIAARALEKSPNALLADTWKRHFHPTLSGTPAGSGSKRAAAESGEAPAPSGGGWAQPSLLPIRSTDFEEELAVENAQPVTRIVRGSMLSSVEPLAGELVDEVQPAEILATPRAARRNPDHAALTRYQVQQAIWSSNFHFLTGHPDVLPAHEIQAVMAELRALIPSEDARALRPGLVGLLVQALTGRTARAFKAVDVATGSLSTHDPRRIILHPTSARLRQAVFWQVATTPDERMPSHFRPTDSQREVLERSLDWFDLELMPEVSEALAHGQAALNWLSCQDVEDIEGHLREAAREVSKRLGYVITPGRLRGSVAPYLVEQSRDVPLAQLICADSLGASRAPLSYYAPRKAAVRDAFWRYQQLVVRSSTPRSAAPDDDERIGAQLLVKGSFGRKLARACSAPLQAGVEKLVREGRVEEVHQAIVSHTVALLVGAYTHRPTDAVGSLRINDLHFDGDQGWALFADKCVDIAHAPRPVVLSSTAIRQLRAYLSHLGALAELRPELADHIDHVMKGDAPLFFDWRPGHPPEALTISRWKAMLSWQWDVVPANWGRTYVRTHAIEAGIAPELVNLQMGHLEATGHPFSGASPTELPEVVSQLAPQWERLVGSLGWRVVDGLARGRRQSAPSPTSLRDWSPILEDEEKRRRKGNVDRQRKEAARLRLMREQAETDIQAHPELVAAGLFEDPASRGPNWTHPLSKADFERIRDQLYFDAADDPVLGIARVDALCRIARQANRAQNTPGHNPANFLRMRRSLDNALLLGGAEAVRQVHAMRKHVEDWSKTNRPADSDDIAAACARIVLALALFGHCDDPAKIRGVIERRGRLARSASLPDLILVPWGDASHEVLALRGIAAAAVARMARKLPGDEFPGWAAVNDILAHLLPHWAVDFGEQAPGVDAGISGLVCQAVGVCNRFELSPAARMAMRDDGGATDAPLALQLALLDGGHARALAGATPNDSMPSKAATAIKQLPRPKGNARSQYLALCSLIPRVGAATTLPRTGHSIPSGKAAQQAGRRHVLAELDSMLADRSEQDRQQPVVALLAGWVRDMLVNGTARTSTPAFKTISTYLTRIGGVLVEVVGTSPLGDMDEGEWEDAYLAAILSSTHSRAKAASAILGLHAFGREVFGLPDVDLAGVMTYLGKGSENRPRTNFPLPSEREATVESLQRRSSEGFAGATPEGVRLVRQAQAAFPLMAYAGMRRSEALGPQHRDLRLDEDLLQLRVRPNSSRRLKTRSGRRDIRISLKDMHAPMLHAWTWSQAERSRLASARVETSFVFSPMNDPRSAESRDDIAAEAMGALREATGRDTRLHDLRHLVAMEQTLPPFLTGEDLALLGSAWKLSAAEGLSGRVVMPRDLHARVIRMGHCTFGVTLRCYLHLAWLLRSRADQRIAKRWETRGVAATLLGTTREGADHSRRSAGQLRPGVAYLNAQWPAKPPGEWLSGVGSASVESGAPHAWGAVELASFIESANSVGHLEHALASHGYFEQEASRLRPAILAAERRVGRRLLSDHELAAVPGRPRRSLRPLGAAQEIGHWLVAVDAGEIDLCRLAEVVMEHAVPTDGDSIRLPSSFVPIFERALPSSMPMVEEPAGAGMSIVRIHRPGVPGRYAGLQVKRVLALSSIALRLARGAAAT